MSCSGILQYDPPNALRVLTRAARQRRSILTERQNTPLFFCSNIFLSHLHSIMLFTVQWYIENRVQIDVTKYRAPNTARVSDGGNAEKKKSCNCFIDRVSNLNRKYLFIRLLPLQLNGYCLLDARERKKKSVQSRKRSATINECVKPIKMESQEILSNLVTFCCSPSRPLNKFRFDLFRKYTISVSRFFLFLKDTR